MISTGHVTLNSSTPTLIYQADADGAKLHIHNDEAQGGQEAYLGDASVTAATGLDLGPREGDVRIELSPYDAIYGIADSAQTPTVSYLVVV